MIEEYVIDTSAFVQGFIRDTYTARVLTVFQRVDVLNQVILNMPEFCLVECANVIWKQVHLYQTIDAEEAKKRLANVRALTVKTHTSFSLLPRALDIALDHQLAVYDTIQLALAETLQLPLITTDEKQARIATTVGVTLKPITDFPEYTP